LLATGNMPGPLTAPLSYQVTPGWRQRLEQAGDNWLTWLHRGVARWHAGEADAARDAWRASLAATENPWALRNLAVCDENPDSAASSLLRAGELLPTPLRALAVETLQALLAADRPRDALTFVDGLPPDLRADGRIQMLECSAAIAAGSLDRAGRLIEAGIVVADLQEGEDALDQLWFAYHERCDPTLPRTAHPLPRSYDFRMTEG
jgi:hypothetical protein